MIQARHFFNLNNFLLSLDTYQSYLNNYQFRHIRRFGVAKLERPVQRQRNQIYFLI